MGLTVLADGEPQLYVPADPAEQPYAWFTMPMLLWWGAAISLLLVAALGMVVALVRRVNRLEDAATERAQPAAPVEEPAPSWDTDTRPDHEAVRAAVDEVEREANRRPSPRPRVDPAEEAWRKRFGLAAPPDKTRGSAT